MEKKDLDSFLEANKHIEWSTTEEGDALVFRNSDLQWYKDNPDKGTKITIGALQKLDAAGLLHEINRGLDVDTITRITGYFAKTRGFNPGKQAELQDRVKGMALDVP